MEAKKYLGRKVLVKMPHIEGCQDSEEKINIVRSFESFKNDDENDIYESIELLEDSITLYYCDVRKPRNLSERASIRDYWLKENSYDYRNFLTKDEIIELLNKDYLVAVEGLKEIDIDDIEKL